MHLAHANTAASSDQRNLCHVVVGTHRKVFAAPDRECLAGSAHERRFFIKANQRVLRQIGQLFAMVEGENAQLRPLLTAAGDPVQVVEVVGAVVMAVGNGESGKVARKIPGHTAIPEGSYRLLITKSPRFKKWLPYVQGVPGFEGIRIHAGNYPDDTQGCILVGENKVKGMVVNSRIWLHRLMNRIQAAENQGEGIWITII